MSGSSSRWRSWIERLWKPCKMSLLKDMLWRVGAMLVAAALIGLGHNRSRALLLPVAIALGAAVFVVWRKTRSGHKGWRAYVAYLGAIVLGVLLLTERDAAQELGLAPLIAVLVGLGAVLAGYAGLLSTARSSSRVRQRAAIVVEAAVIIAAIVASYAGAVILERSDGSNPAWFLLLGGSLLVVYVMLSLLSESLVEQRPVKAPDGGSGGGDATQLHRVVPAQLHVTSWIWPVVAVVVVVAGALWLLIHVNLSGWIVGVAVILLLLFFYASAADGIADVAAVLVIVSLSWSLAHRTEEFHAEPLAARETVLIALGDSYISGEGATEFFEGTNDRGRNECRRAPSAYAPRLVERTTVPDLTRLVFIACSGATAANFDARVQYENEPPDGPPRLRDNGVWQGGATQLEQLDDVLREVRAPAYAPTDDPEANLHGLVLVSLGGNDAGFGKIATTCVALGNCGDVVDAWTADLARVHFRLDRAYGALRSVIGPRVPVLVIPYPVPLAERRCDLSAMTQDEHTGLRRFVEQLNTEVRQAAEAAGFYYLDIQSAFEGHRICDTEDSDDWYLNYLAANPTGGSFASLSNPRNWFHNSFHPNSKGHEAIAGAIAGWMADHEGEIAGSRFELPEEPFRQTYLAADVARPSEQLATIGSGACAVSGKSWEGRWSACETGKSLRLLVVPAMLFLVATWVVAFTLLHLYRRWTDRRPAAVAGSGASPPELQLSDEL